MFRRFLVSVTVVATAVAAAVVAAPSSARIDSSLASSAGQVQAGDVAPVALSAPPATEPVGPRELVERRTQTSRTSAMPDGTLRTELFTGPIHYRDGAGRWQSIDNTLVASSRAGWAWENRANAYGLLMASDPSRGLRFEAGGHWVRMVPAKVPAGVSKQGATATYSGWVEDAQLRYTAANGGVKEEIVLSEVPDTTAFTFTLQLSPGLSMRDAGARGIEFVDAAGAVAFGFTLPYMFDAAGTIAPPEALTMQLTGTGSSRTITVTADRTWLADPARQFPVTIDPTITVRGGEQFYRDCQVSSGTGERDQSGCTWLRTRAGVDAGNKRRALVRFDIRPLRQSTMEVLSADLQLYLEQSTSTRLADYGVHRVTKDWDETATWNSSGSCAACGPWSGGSFGSFSWDTRSLSGVTPGYKSWHIPGLVQDWVDERAENYGVAVTQLGESVENVLWFFTEEWTDSSRWPKLVVTHTDGIGERKGYTFESQELNDRMEAKVNVANGNLLLKETDLEIAGTGLDTSFLRYYNSLAQGASTLGAGWVSSLGQDVALTFNSDGAIFHAPSGYQVRFHEESDGSFGVRGAGLDATLTKRADGRYELEWFSKEVFVFGLAGRWIEHRDKNGNTITLAYTSDASTNNQTVLSRVTDTRGRTVDFTYLNGRLTGVTDNAGGRSYSYGYDATGRLASYAVTAYGLATDNVNVNAVTEFAYDTADRLTTVTDPRGNTTRIGYDGDTRRVKSVTRVTDANAGTGPTSTFTYPTVLDQCAGEADAVNEARVDAERTEVADVTTYCTDKHNRVVATFDAKGHKTRTDYTSNSNVTALNESGVAAGPAYGFAWSGDSNLTTVSLPTGGQAFMDYADPGNSHFPTAVRDFSAGSATAPATWAYDYDDDGNLIEAFNNRGTADTGDDIRFRYCYNGDGTPQRIDAAPTTTVLDTDTTTGCGTAGQGNDTLYSYNTAGELTTIDRPGLHGTQTFTYDALSRIATIRDGRGVITRFAYDALDRITRIDYEFTSPSSPLSGQSLALALTPPDDEPDPSSPSTQTTWITYSYDPNGNLTARSDSSGNTTFQYDTLNRMTKEAPEAPSAVTTYAYDPASNVTSIAVSDEPRPVTYAYDKTNLVGSIIDQAGRTTTFGYNQRGLRTDTTYPNGVRMKTAWDDTSRMRCTYAYTGTAPTTGADNCPTPSTGLLTFFRYDYTDTVAGVQIDTNRREAVTGRDGAITRYDYDSISRLTQARTTNTAGAVTREHAYTYDKVGNLTQEQLTGTTVANETRTQAYNAANELCWTATGSHTPDCASAPASATNYTYDSAGNLETSSSGLSADYSLRNHTIAITPPGSNTAINMDYTDATQDRRILAGDTRMAYNQLGLSSQGPTNGNQASWFVRDPDGTLVAMLTSNNNGDLYYLLDTQGSVAATTNTTGSLVRRYAYEPYGEEINPSTTDPNPWRYASGYYDTTTGMLKFGTRYHMPNLTRWTQPDPVAGSPTNPMTLNTYTYAGCNPTNNTDPTGRVFHEDVFGFIDKYLEPIWNCLQGAAGLEATLGIYATIYGGLFGPKGIVLAHAGVLLVGCGAGLVGIPTTTTGP